MAFERDASDLEIQRLEAQLQQSSFDDFENDKYPFTSDDFGESGYGQGEPISLHAVETLHQALQRAQSGRSTSVRDWRKAARPKSASYMRPSSRVTPTGGGGAPLNRPSSAPAGRQPPKTERWRESGMTRWPRQSDKMHHASDTSDGDPLRRGPAEQPGWTGELWIRSLRRPGVEIQDPQYHDVAQRGMREMHEEWQAPGPMPPSRRRPHSARGGYSLTARGNGQVPYSGSTAIGKVALPRKHDMKNWVERPVATGKMALTHLAGQRYGFSQATRGLIWEEYLRDVIVRD